MITDHSFSWLVDWLYKAKPAIDIVIYRGGGMLYAWTFTGLTQGLGSGMAAVGAVIVLLWAATGVHLRRRFNAIHP